MIIVEKRLNDAFAQLPPIGGFKPVYKWGNEMHLLKQLKAYSDANESPYPLIYQTSNESEQDTVKKICETKLVLVIATRNTETDLLNDNRWAMSYKSVLYPVLENIEKVILRAGIFNSLPSYRLTNFPNYGSGTENFTADIWDALQVEFLDPLVITNDCINTQIKF